MSARAQPQPRIPHVRIRTPYRSMHDIGCRAARDGELGATSSRSSRAQDEQPDVAPRACTPDSLRCSTPYTQVLTILS